MYEVTTDQQRRRRAGFGLTAIIFLTLAGLVCVTALVLSHYITSDREPGLPPHPIPLNRPPDAGEQWDLAAEYRLAAQPMTVLPAEASQPQPLTVETAGSATALPSPGQTSGRWIPRGFPGTPEGALAQLKALDEAAMRGGDPDTYVRGYTEVALPGAPAPETTGLYGLLRSMRGSAGLKPTGVVANLAVNYQVTHGQIKGSTDGGRYVVVCVLGQLSVDYKGQTITAGVGDCQALRWSGEDWRISPGPLAAPAPNAWPGSHDAVIAGYREVT